MRRKILWITFGMTMAFWFGCASRGEDQNYKVLEEDAPMLEPDRNNPRPGMSAAPATTPAPSPREQLAAQQAAINETTPSVTSMDRSNWPKVAVRPDSGLTYHKPIYFQDRETAYERRQIERAHDTDEMLAASLEGHRADTWSMENAKDLFIQPLNYAKDMILLPVRAVVQPPWTEVHTP
jgi:hypothetical protein